MRRYKRFKLYSKNYLFPSFCSIKLLYFKRPKWLLGQSRLLRLALGKGKKIKQKQKLLSSRVGFRLKKRGANSGFYSSFSYLSLNSKHLINSKFWDRAKPISKRRRSKSTRAKKRQKLFYNVAGTQVLFGVWDRAQRFFKNSLIMRTRVNHYFDGGFSNRLLKNGLGKDLSHLNVFRSLFIKPEFRADILLWRLNFFPSIHSARIAFRRGLVLVNGCKVLFNHYVKRGDVVLVNIETNFQLVTNSKIRGVHFCPFVEIDYYTNTVVILYDASSLPKNSFSLIVRERFNSYVQKNYLLK